MKKKIGLVPSAYNPAAMGDVENFIEFYKDDFDVYVITHKETETGIEEIDGVKYVEEGRRYATYIKTTAEYIIDAGTLSSENKVYKDQKRISVWHGIPYKKMFVDLDKKHAVTAVDYSKGYDLMVSPSEWYTERFLRKSMLYDGEVLETAISRTDSLFISEEKKEAIREELGIPENKKVLLYAPTYRERGVFKIPFDVKRVQQALGQEWVIVIKAHYLNTIDEKEGIIDATSYPSINNLMTMTDCMITDYSSTLFDYSVLGKPALLYQYDREQYEAERSFMFSMEEYLDQKYILFEENMLLDRLKEIDTIGDNLVKIRENFYPHQVENSTEQLIKKLNLDSAEREISEVIFLVNSLNEIGGVHSFILNLAKELKKAYDAKVYVFGINEFNFDRDKAYIFDKEDVTDIKLSYENNPGTVRSILAKTDGYVVSCQYSAHLKFQKYLKNKKSVLMFHGDTKDIVNRNMYTWHLDSLNRGRLRNYSKLAFLTEGNCKVIEDALNEDIREKIVSLENGMDFSDAADLYKESGDFVLVSRLDSDKNPIEAIELFSNDKLNPSYKLHIYGDGSLKHEIENMIKERHLEDRIILHGFVADKKEIFAGKQGLISTSLSEGFGLTIIEGIKYGIPAYAYDSYTACEELVDEKIGKRVETGNIDAFVEALNKPFDMSKFDNTEILEKYSNEKVTKKWKDIFDSIDDAEVTLQKTKSKSKKKKKKTLKSIKSRIRESEFLQDNEKYAELAVMWRNIKRRERGKERPLVTVIMPFYNNNKTIRKAVKSVEKCGYKNYELILINDGSKEDPHKRIRFNDKIRYYYKDNGGLSSTRNYGLDRAKGKYVFFLDSDDIVYPDALRKLVNYAEKNDLDMVCGKTVRRYVDQKEEEYWYPYIYKKTYVNTSKKRNLLIDDTIATGKLYRLDTLNSMYLRFKDGVYEDILFTGQLYASLDRIGVIKSVVQKWMVYGSNTSITTSRNYENARKRLENIDAVFKMHDSEIIKVYYTRQYVRHHMIACLQGYNNLSVEEKRCVFNLLKEGTELRKDYYFERMVNNVAKRELFKAILNDDFERFDILATGFALE